MPQDQDTTHPGMNGGDEKRLLHLLLPDDGGEGVGLGHWTNLRDKTA
jgi:hypothetical protein